MHQLLDSLLESALGGTVVTLPFVVGLGSHHGDDQAGWLVVSRLKRLGYPGPKLVSLQHPADMFDVLDAEQPLVICDACVGDGVPGTIHCFSWPTDRVAYQRASISHDLSLGDVMELGRQLRCLPEQAQIWTVKADSWSAGSEPSLEVQSATIRIADAIWRDYQSA